MARVASGTGNVNPSGAPDVPSNFSRVRQMLNLLFTFLIYIAFLQYIAFYKKKYSNKNEREDVIISTLK
jgi:hypothetical protein